MNGLFQAALEVQGFFQRHGWSFAIIGGVAVLRWGEPYATQDVDFTLLTGFGNESSHIDQILRHFQPRVADAGHFALENRVLLIRASNAVAIDIALAGIPFEEQIIHRSSVFSFLPEVNLRTCSAEDLVILKAFAGRPKDWAALNGILARQQGKLDWSYIRSHLTTLCELKGEPELVDRLELLRNQTEPK
jgi:hypothetical protein